MSEERSGPVQDTPAPWTLAELESLVHELGAQLEPLDGRGQRLAQVEALEAIKAAAAAAQVRITAAYAADETARVEASRGRAGERSGRRRPAAGPVVGSQVALARRESPARGRTLVDASMVLVHDLPSTLTTLARGEISEDRALMVVRETAHLSSEDRRVLDAELGEGSATGPGGLGGLGAEQLRQAIQRIALRLDDEAASRRMRRARSLRRVSGRLLGDGTGRITAVVKAEQYAAVLGALGQAATKAKAAGDPRTRDQVRADALVERVTGQSQADAGPVSLNLVMGVESLLADSTEPGFLQGVSGASRGVPAGFLPSGLCRDLFRRAGEAGRASVRRLFTRPSDRQLVAMESDSRAFAGLLADLVLLRDGGTCRTPWCDAPARHVDHAVPVAECGPTSFDNGQGLCETCNYVKETPGWSTSVRGGDATHQVFTVTPAGHLYASRPPPTPGGPGRRPRHRPVALSPMEHRLASLLEPAS